MSEKHLHMNGNGGRQLRGRWGNKAWTREGRESDLLMNLKYQQKKSEHRTNDGLRKGKALGEWPDSSDLRLGMEEARHIRQER